VSRDSQYQDLPRPQDGLKHRYGAQVNILSFPYPMTLLTELCSSGTRQPRVNQLVCMLFDWLLGEVASRELSLRPVTTNTRMHVYNKEGVYAGQGIDRQQQVVVVDIARAGIIPAQRFFDGLNQLLDPDGVRQDHIFMNRITDAAGQVVGVNVAGNKIGGPIGDATVIIPDPMGATGGSMIDTLRRYVDHVPGKPRKIIAAHLIVTPEYLKAVTGAFPDVQIYAVRLDRGLSSPEVLEQVPGVAWDQERGLNDQQYIVPGGGGFGEIMNNAWV
jgi:uracil phosphoribosyltransferase